MRILFKYKCNPFGKAWMFLFASYSLYLNRVRSLPNDLRKKSFNYCLLEFAVTESRISIHSSACDDIVLHVPEKAINHRANYLFLMALRRNALYPSKRKDRVALTILASFDAKKVFRMTPTSRAV